MANALRAPLLERRALKRGCEANYIVDDGVDMGTCFNRTEGGSDCYSQLIWGVRNGLINRIHERHSAQERALPWQRVNKSQMAKRFSKKMEENNRCGGNTNKKQQDGADRIDGGVVLN